MASMSNPKFELVQDDAVSALSEHSVVTSKGECINADVVVLCTGFRTQDFTYPLEIYNGEGESLLKRFRETNARTYRGTFVSGFPNFVSLSTSNL